MMVTNDEMYKSIVSKLGFEPKDYTPDLKDYECDNFESPFDILSLDELRFLLQNDCFRNATG